MKMSSLALHITQPQESNREFKKLQDYKEDLVFQLSSANLVSFSEELYKSVVISREVKSVFVSLDHDRLDSEIKVRYLLQHVFEGVKRNVTVFYRFLKVLTGLGTSVNQVFRRLSEELNVSEKGEGQTSDEKSSSKVVVDDISLSEDDVPTLMDSLVEVSNKWEEIGIALGLPRHTISECKGSSNAVSMTNILCGWVSCKHQDITLSKLKLALGSQLVKRSSFAPTMEKMFRDAKGRNTTKSGSGSTGDEAGSKADIGAKLSLVFDEVCLYEDDISILSELLVICAHKWNHIGTALGLPVSILKTLETNHLTSEADILCLRDILFAWITGAHGSARYPTLNNLKLTLESQLVGLRTTAYDLEERLIKARRQFILSVPTMPAAKRPHLDSTMEIIYQSRDIEVADGKSTLMEVQVIPNGSLSYQWLKNGQPISDDQAYSGVFSDILVVSRASQGTEGEFTCRISKGHDKEVVSDVIVLIVIFPLEKTHLLNLYSKRREVPKDLWPIVSTSTFINLSLFWKNTQGNDDYNYSVQGDVSYILKTKKKVDYKEVFGKYESGSLMLVEGRSGSGKSTLIHKVTSDWATNGGVLKNAKMVFHIHLQNLATRKDENLSDILEIFYRSKTEREKMISDMETSLGKGTCFVFDGLDEYQPQDESTSVIYQLFYKVYLPAAMIIVASGPIAATSLRQEATVTSRIEVLGFNKEHIFEFIDKFPFSPNNGSSPSNLKAYLDSHLNVLHMCYLPLHVAMICFLYEHEKGDIPRSETKIYEHFTRFTVLRKLRRSNKKCILQSLEDLYGENRFRNICNLAFHMTIQSKQVIRHGLGDVPLFRLDDASSLGLVTIDNTAALYGLDDTYAFLHLTFQEYLAAFYIAKLGEDKQMEIIRSCAGEEQMLMVWKFYYGMVEFEDKKAQIELIMTSADTLHRVRYAFESQQRAVCDSIFEFGRTSVLDFNVGTLAPADLTALGYVMSTTSHPVTKLAMKWCDLHGDHMRAFLREVSNHKLMCIQTLDLSCNHIGADGTAALAKVLKSFNSLQTLELYDNKIGADGAAALAEGLKSCNNLQSLHLAYNNIGDDGAAALAEGLKFLNLQTLHISDNSIGDDGAMALANLKCRIHHY